MIVSGVASLSIFLFLNSCVLSVEDTAPHTQNRFEVCAALWKLVAMFLGYYLQIGTIVAPSPELCN